MVRDAFPLRNVNDRPQNERSGRTETITQIQNPYYCDDDIDLTEPGEGIAV